MSDDCKRGAYGANGFSSASSDTPDKHTVSPLAREMQARDPALAAVRARGVKRDYGFQIRGDESAAMYPPTFGSGPIGRGAPRGDVPNTGTKPVRSPTKV